MLGSIICYIDLMFNLSPKAENLGGLLQSVQNMFYRNISANTAEMLMFQMHL